MKENEITKIIIGCAIRVHKSLGSGLLINFNVLKLTDGLKRVISLSGSLRFAFAYSAVKKIKN